MAAGRYRRGMRGGRSLERRLLLNASLAAAVTGALIALAGCVFATFVGHPPSAPVLAAVVGACAAGSGVAACAAIMRSPRLRRALGLAARP